ncbi:hypothetical protein KGO95_02760 [Patescibacteria group bacterium]|nr:hypothetical protein [Patescibacteria group bacterium]
MDMITRNTRLFAVGIAVTAFLCAPQMGTPVARAAGSSDPSFSNPGLLPTNPFYFLKVFARSAERALTIDPISRANLEAGILDQKAGELQSLEQILGSADTRVEAAAGPYGDSIDRLQADLQNITATSDKNKNVDALLTHVLQVSTSDMAIFDQLESVGDLNMRDQLEALDGKVSSLIAGSFARLDTASGFQGRLSVLASNSNSDLLSEMVLARSLSRIADAVPADSSLQSPLLLSTDHLLYSILADMETTTGDGAVAALIDQLPGTKLRTIMVIDELQERATDAAVQNTLSIIRQHLVDISQDDQTVSKPAAQALSAEADTLATFLHDQARGVRSSALLALVVRARSFADEADTSFSLGQYGDAAWSASLSLAASRNGLTYLARNDQDVLTAEVKQFETQYDVLLNTAQDAGVSQDTEPGIMALFSEAETALGNASDLIGPRLDLDKVVAAVRTADLSLEQADAAVQEYLQQMKVVAAAAQAAKPALDRVLPPAALN